MSRHYSKLAKAGVGSLAFCRAHREILGFVMDSKDLATVMASDMKNNTPTEALARLMQGSATGGMIFQFAATVMSSNAFKATGM